MALADRLAGLTIRDARELLDSREVSSVELAEAHLERIDGVDERVKAFVTVTADLALAQAARADERIAAGQAGPTHRDTDAAQGQHVHSRRRRQPARRVCSRVSCRRSTRP